MFPPLNRLGGVDRNLPLREIYKLVCNELGFICQRGKQKHTRDNNFSDNEGVAGKIINLHGAPKTRAPAAPIPPPVEATTRDDQSCWETPHGELLTDNRG